MRRFLSRPTQSEGQQLDSSYSFSDNDGGDDDDHDEGEPGAGEGTLQVVRPTASKEAALRAPASAVLAGMTFCVAGYSSVTSRGGLKGLIRRHGYK